MLLEPDENVRAALETLLQGEGWSLLLASDCCELENVMKGHDVIAVVSESSLPGCDPARILGACKDSDVPVVFIGHELPLQGAVDLIRAGALDYLEKPFSQTRLTDLLKQTLTMHNK